MNIKLVYASLTGNTEMLSDLMIEKFEEEKGLEIEKLFIEDMEDFDFLDDADAFIVASYTYGEGELPEEMEEFFEALADKNYEGKIYGVIGTGDTIYDEYCVCVDQFDEQIAKTGATNPTENLKIEIEADTDEDFEKEIFEDNFTVIVIYDIVSNKRRIQLSKLLSAFGFRIQRSAFECLLTREKYKLLVEKINRYAKAEDLIRIYRLNQNVVTEIYGEKLEAENENKVYYFF